MDDWNYNRARIPKLDGYEVRLLLEDGRERDAHVAFLGSEQGYRLLYGNDKVIHSVYVDFDDVRAWKPR